MRKRKSNSFKPVQEYAPQVRLAAGNVLPLIAPPKVRAKQQTQSSFSKRTPTTSSDIRLPITDRGTANIDALTLRFGINTKETIRALATVSPDLSASVWAYQRMVVTRNHKAVARNEDGTANREATQALQQVISRMNSLTDYSSGFNNISSIQAVGEALAKELRLYGSCSLELVLDKALLPSRFQPISTTQIAFFEAKDGMNFPVQIIGGREINLDIPGFFYEVLDQDLLTAYSDSPMEAALQATLADHDFSNDLRRVIKRALHPRLDATIDVDQFRKQMPHDAMGDPEKTRQFEEAFFASIDQTVNGLEPDDALVHFGSIKFDYLNNGNVTLNKEWDSLQAMNNAKMATGTKTPPAVLGHGAGSQNIASSESMLFVKYAEGIQAKLNSIFSRAFTLALRLLGFDVYCQFSFDDIDLRPTAELEAFKAMKQSRILELLSIGLIGDEEACLELTGRLPADGAKPLSGTFFKQGSSDPNAAPYSNTGQNATEQAITPDTPQQPKGPAKKEPKP